MNLKCKHVITLQNLELLWCSGITCASHAQGPQFEPGQKQYTFFERCVIRIIILNRPQSVCKIKISEYPIV